MSGLDIAVGLQLFAGFAFLGVIIWALTFGRETIAKQPKNRKQKKLVDDVIAKIQQFAPDFAGATVVATGYEDNGGGGVNFSSLRGLGFRYDFRQHGYTVSKPMAWILANQIAEQFGGEIRRIESSYSDSTIGYRVLGPREIAKEKAERQRYDNMTHL